MGWTLLRVVTALPLFLLCLAVSIVHVLFVFVKIFVRLVPYDAIELTCAFLLVDPPHCLRHWEIPTIGYVKKEWDEY